MIWSAMRLDLDGHAVLGRPLRRERLDRRSALLVGPDEQGRAAVRRCGRFACRSARSAADAAALGAAALAAALGAAALAAALAALEAPPPLLLHALMMTTIATSSAPIRFVTFGLLLSLPRLPAIMLAASTPPWIGPQPGTSSIHPRPPASSGRFATLTGRGAAGCQGVVFVDHPTEDVLLRPPSCLVLLRGGSESRPVRKTGQ